MKSHSKFLACILISAFAIVTSTTAQNDTPALPGETNFNFIRGIVKNYVADEQLSILGPDGEVQVFVMPAGAAVVNQSGKPVKPKALQPGADVTVTVRDPREAEAPSTVHQVVIANPLKESASRQMVEGLVLNARKGQNAITLRPSVAGAANISFNYDEGATEFVGGDGLDVAEEQLQAGDRILVSLMPQKNGGLMAERIVYLGDSAEPAGDLDVDGAGLIN